jgi:hypothetical protein
MGYPVFYWKPHQIRRSAGDPKIETIQLSEDLSDLQVTPRRDVVDAYSIHGGRSRELLRAWLDVRIVLDRFNDRALFRKFSAMINHLERGGHVAFSVDSDKLWNAFLTSNAGQTSTKLYHGSNQAIEWGSSVTTLGTDEIVVESMPPKSGREYQAVTTHTYDTAAAEGVITLADSMNLFDTYREGAHVRYSDYYPNLCLDSRNIGGALLTHDHRITSTLDLPMVYIMPLPPVAKFSQPSPNGSKDPPDWSQPQ